MAGKGRLINPALTVLLAFLVGTAGRAAHIDPAGALLAAGSLLADPGPAVQAAGLVLQQALPQEHKPQEPAEEEPAPEPLPADPPAPLPSPVPQEPSPPPEPPPRPEGALPVQEQHFGQGSGDGYITLPAGSIKNLTSLSDGEVARLAGAGLPFEVEVGSSEPQVLVMHTHTTESFLLNDGTWSDPEDTGRSTAPEENTVQVGEALAGELNAAGIYTLHDTTLHDYPSYVGSYERSKATVQEYLRQYPSIKAVLDVHRDAIERDGVRIAPVARLPEGRAAQVMVICGCDRGGNLPRFERNLAFAAAWESTLEGLYPGLTRPVLFDYRYYNQDLTTGSLLIEIGGHGNTLEQAVLSGHLVGRALVRLFGAG